MSDVACPQGLTRFKGRSYLAFALAPEAPIVDWLAELDRSLAKAAGFFANRPVVLDLAAVHLSKHAINHLLSELRSRGLHIMGIEGADAGQLGPELPPLLNGGRPAADLDATAASAADAAPDLPRRRPTAGSLVLDQPVRSGQSIIFPDGDVIVLGSVASGAEIMAGGSIHVYGTLRGQAFAGANGDRSARIFCSKLEAELMAVDGYYTTAETLGTHLRGRSAQAWLDGNVLMVAPLG